MNIKNSDEDVKLLKAIISCNPQWVDEETLTVVSLKPIKDLIDDILEERVGEIRREISDISSEQDDGSIWCNMDEVLNLPSLNK
jgi:hypothetical protein